MPLFRCYACGKLRSHYDIFVLDKMICGCGESKIGHYLEAPRFYKAPISWIKLYFQDKKWRLTEYANHDWSEYTVFSK